MLGLASLTMVAPCRLFHRLGRHRHALLRQWFGIGVLTAAMLGTSAVFLLLKEVVNAMIWVKEVGGSPCTGWLLHLSAQWVPAGPCTPAHSQRWLFDIAEQHWPSGVQAMAANSVDSPLSSTPSMPLLEAKGSQGWVLGLAVPGLTVPWTHSIYLWLATAISIGVHEVSSCTTRLEDGCLERLHRQSLAAVTAKGPAQVLTVRLLWLPCP